MDQLREHDDREVDLGFINYLVSILFFEPPPSTKQSLGFKRSHVKLMV